MGLASAHLMMSNRVASGRGALAQEAPLLLLGGRLHKDVLRTRPVGVSRGRVPHPSARRAPAAAAAAPRSARSRAPLGRARAPRPPTARERPARRQRPSRGWPRGRCARTPLQRVGLQRVARGCAPQPRPSQPAAASPAPQPPPPRPRQRRQTAPPASRAAAGGSRAAEERRRAGAAARRRRHPPWIGRPAASTPRRGHPAQRQPEPVLLISC